MRRASPGLIVLFALLVPGCVEQLPSSGPEPVAEQIQRSWSEPVTIADGGFNEPLLATHSDGTIYYSPTRRLFRSDDGGETWTRIDPPTPPAAPQSDLGTDTSVSVAPDGTVWWTRFWPYLGPTLGCASHDKGATWTCDNLAITGTTDRMWIFGVSDEEAYLSANHAFSAYEWRRTTNGGQIFEPYGYQQQLGFMGNMVRHDDGRLWQVLYEGGGLHLITVSDVEDLQVPNGKDTGVKHSFGLSQLALADDVLWLAGEPVNDDGSRGLVAARSRDFGATWEQLPIPTQAKTATFATIAAIPGGRVALTYYGSDTAAPPESNGGTWSVYVAETHNGLDAQPTWTETLVDEGVHVGSRCAGVACGEQSPDPNARNAGDFMGIWIEDDGDILVGYVDDTDSGIRKAQFARQDQVSP